MTRASIENIDSLKGNLKTAAMRADVNANGKIDEDEILIFIREACNEKCKIQDISKAIKNSYCADNEFNLKQSASETNNLINKLDNLANRVHSEQQYRSKVWQDWSLDIGAIAGLYVGLKCKKPVLGLVLGAIGLVIGLVAGPIVNKLKETEDNYDNKEYMLFKASLDSVIETNKSSAKFEDTII